MGRLLDISLFHLSFVPTIIKYAIIDYSINKSLYLYPTIHENLRANFVALV